MKRKVIFGYLKSSIFFILTIFLSCNDDYVGYDVQMEKLDKIGQDRASFHGSPTIRF